MINKPLRHGPKTSRVCVICEKEVRNALFMVKNDLWFEAGMKKKDLAHMECFVEKLGRPLVYQDFNGSEINDVWMAGMKLPCCYCLFEELKKRYSVGRGIDATFAKLKLAHFGGRDYPPDRMIVDKCTCE